MTSESARWFMTAVGALAMPSTAFAVNPPLIVEHGQNTGVGLIIGEPTGLCGVMKLAQPQAVAAAVAWSLPDKRIHVHADYLITLTTYEDWEFPKLKFPISAGVGVRVRIGWDEDPDNDTPVFGIRVPFNLAVDPTEVPVDFFIELVPVVGLYPATRFDLDAALGARFYFR